MNLDGRKMREVVEIMMGDSQSKRRGRGEHVGQKGARGGRGKATERGGFRNSYVIGIVHFIIVAGMHGCQKID